jgi:hypothetical protein
MAFQIRDLVGDVWPEEGEGYLLGCTFPSCGGKSGGDDDDDQGDDQGDDKSGDKSSKSKYAPSASDSGLALLQRQLRQSLAQEL